MKDPFKSQDPMVRVANAAVPILIDRLGGTVTVSESELVGLADRYGGTVGVAAEEVEPGVFRLTLVAAKAGAAEGPVS